MMQKSFSTLDCSFLQFMTSFEQKLLIVMLSLSIFFFMANASVGFGFCFCFLKKSIEEDDILELSSG